MWPFRVPAILVQEVTCQDSNPDPNPCPNVNLNLNPTLTAGLALYLFEATPAGLRAAREAGTGCWCRGCLWNRLEEAAEPDDAAAEVREPPFSFPRC